MRLPPPAIAPFLLFTAACLASGTCAADTAPAAASGNSTGTETLALAPSFDLEIIAPEPALSLLTRHLALGRYREVPDLDEAELARLVTLAETQARRLLGTLGFFNPDLSVVLDAGARVPRITLRVAPGTATRVHALRLDFEGDIATSAEPGARDQRQAVHAGWRLPPGRPWTQQEWDAAKADALRTLVARRYPRGRVAHSQARIDALAGQAQLELRLDSGPAFFLGPLQVQGIERYDPRLVPRLARLAPGEPFNEDALGQAQQRLASSGYFDAAFLHVDPQSDPRAAPVEVSLREAPVQRLVLGLGVTTDRGPRASFEHRHNRVPVFEGRAVTRLELERKAPLAQTEWTAVPDERGWRWGVLASTSRLRDDNQVTRDQRIRVGRILSDEPIDRHAYLQLDRARVSASGERPPADTGDGASITAHYLWTGRYFDRLISPTRGFGAGLEAAAGVTLTGRRGAFQRTVVRTLHLLPLTEGRLQLRAEGGVVIAAADTRVPSTQLFRTGGDTTVRGYGFRDIGAQRPDASTRAGRYLAVGSIEWQRPLRRGGVATAWEHKLFADAGLVTDRGSRRQPSIGLGTGLRFASPLGPLQLDLAYGLRAHRLRLHLNFGVSF